MPVSFPYLVRPYPDEMLGSWLYRIQIHNDFSFAERLVKETIHRNIERSEWRDMTYPSMGLGRLLSSIGTAYADAMLNQTTYPYWLRFHAEREFDFENHGSHDDIPALILKNRREKLPSMRIVLPFVARVCPYCLDEDFECYGEIYLHRAHHLPFVRVCHIHDMELITRCPSCGLQLQMKSTFSGATLSCSCGCDFRRVRLRKHQKHEAFATLARYSAAILFNREPVEECGTVFQFFDADLKNSRMSTRTELGEYLTGVYGGEAAKAMLTLAPQRSDIYTFSATMTASKYVFRAPQMSAFWAARDRDIANTSARLKSFIAQKTTARDEKPVKTRREQQARIPANVDEAREYVREVDDAYGKNWTRTNVYRKYKTLFWYVMLFDREWFSENYPPRLRRDGKEESIPSIEEDRVVIRRAILHASRSRVRNWANLSQQGYFRATLRDAEWLEERKRETAAERERDKLADKAKYVARCLNDIKQAFEQMQANRERGVHVSLSDLASYTTVLNSSQLRHSWQKMRKFAVICAVLKAGFLLLMSFDRAIATISDVSGKYSRQNDINVPFNIERSQRIS